MEVTALCISLMMNVWMLAAQAHFSYCAQKHDAAFLSILPNRLQFFEYESISFTCQFDGSAGWRLRREINETNSSNWAPSAGFGTIEPAFSSDSGAYWCEDGDGLRSSAVNITVTAGDVILESSVLPVKEGADVTLSCKKRKSAAGLIADFYKDGLRIRTGYKGNMTINNVSTSDGGLYKCNISGAGESAESRLAVRDGNNVKLVFSEPHEEQTHPPQSHPPSFPTLLWIVGSVSLGALLLLGFVCGVLHCRKHTGEGSTTKVSDGDGLVDPNHATYAVVKKSQRVKVAGVDEVVDSPNATYALVQKQRKKKVTGGGDLVDPHQATYALVKRKEKVSKESTKPRLPEESAVYSTIDFPVGNVFPRESRPT